MRKSIGVILVILVITAFGLLSCSSTPQDEYFLDSDINANVYVRDQHKNIEKVAIMPFKAPTELIGSSVSDMWVTEVLKFGRYELVERGQMAQVLNESELSLAGLSASKAVEIGNMMGADGVIIGTVDEYGNIADGGDSYPVVGISTRMINCSNGRVVWSVDLAARSDDDEMSLPQYARAVVHQMVAGLYAECQILDDD